MKTTFFLVCFFLPSPRQKIQICLNMKMLWLAHSLAGPCGPLSRYYMQMFYVSPVAQTTTGACPLPHTLEPTPAWSSLPSVVGTIALEASREVGHFLPFDFHLPALASLFRFVTRSSASPAPSLFPSVLPSSQVPSRTEVLNLWIVTIGKHISDGLRNLQPYVFVATSYLQFCYRVVSQSLRPTEICFSMVVTLRLRTTALEFLFLFFPFPSLPLPSLS